MHLQKGSFFRLKLAGVYFLILLAPFVIARIVLFFEAHSFFKDLTATSIFYSFFQGLRFDIFSICKFCGIFLFLINIPVNSKIYIKINCFVMNIFVLFSGFFLTADIIYFKLFEKHFTTEPLLIKNHFSYFLNLALNDYIFITVTIVLFVTILLIFSLRTVNRYYMPPNRKIGFNVAITLLLSLVLVVAVRGGVQTRILSIVDAYSQNRTSGELKLNGIFTSLVSICSRTLPNKINISDSKALQFICENLLDTHEEVLPDKQCPLMRRRIKFNIDGKSYNVVFILLESWQKDYTDSLAGTNYGVTPNFDALVSDSIVFDNFYANGQRSIMALMSVFFSFPYVKGMPYIGFGLENCGQTRLPAILAQNGYDNVFVQGDKRESDNAVVLANYLGFKESYGKQDIPIYHKYLPIEKGYDIEGLEFFFKKVKFLKEPFFAFYFTTTVHIPYVKTILKSLEKYPEDGTEKTGYLNRLFYCDYALGEFFKKAKREKWFDRTIFILCSDHQAYGVGGANGTFEKTKIDKTFKIPAIIYCPALFKHKIDHKLASHVDIVPTIIDILHIKTPYSSLGKSLVSAGLKRFVFLSYEGEQVYLINNNGNVSQDWNNNSNTDTDYIEEYSPMFLLLSIEKTIYNLTMRNKWYDEGRSY
ncbi:MAG: sulfatase-like hydrolase/transferase [Endomicrobium sp.]|nr:sulfatase-like hydrolase/transferase [Endomicrobium sp.]